MTTSSLPHQGLLSSVLGGVGRCFEIGTRVAPLHGATFFVVEEK